MRAARRQRAATGARPGRTVGDAEGLARGRGGAARLGVSASGRYRQPGGGPDPVLGTGLSGALPAVPAGRLGAPRILVIDDSRSMRELLRLHLANAGYEVVTAEDAIAGGKALLVQSPDLIITDINMPYMTGIEFVAALRADRTIPPIPVIFLSSRQEDLADHARQLQAVAHLPKPVSLERLLGVVALHAGEGQPLTQA